jgi:hypothetical protein
VESGEVHFNKISELRTLQKLQPNQSLKLTEPAIDDFAARCWTDLGASDWNVRATNYLAAAVRRRSLAPVR